MASVDKRNSIPLLVAVGCLNIDISAGVPHLPERDGRIMSRGFHKTLGGMACNVACAAAALGEPLAVELIAPLGCDEDSRWAQAQLRARGIDIEWLDRRTSTRTCTCLILVEPNGARAIISEPSRLRYAQLLERLAAGTVKPRARLLHVDGFHAPGVLTGFRNARASGWRTSVDLDELPPDYLVMTRLSEMLDAFDVVFINRGCATTLLAGDAGHWPARLAELAADSDTLFLLTLGAQGAMLVQPGLRSVEISTPAVDTVDTTGAGDVFAGVFLGCWLTGLTAREAARKACIAAALSTTARGALGYLPDAAAIATLDASG